MPRRLDQRVHRHAGILVEHGTDLDANDDVLVRAPPVAEDTLVSEDVESDAEADETDAVEERLDVPADSRREDCVVGLVEGFGPRNLGLRGRDRPRDPLPPPTTNSVPISPRNAAPRTAASLPVAQ